MGTRHRWSKFTSRLGGAHEIRAMQAAITHAEEWNEHGDFKCEHKWSNEDGWACPASAFCGALFDQDPKDRAEFNTASMQHLDEVCRGRHGSHMRAIDEGDLRFLDTWRDYVATLEDDLNREEQM